MRLKASIPLYLSSLPALSAAAVLTLCALTLADLATHWLAADTRREIGPGPLLPEEINRCLIAGDSTTEVPCYSEEEALGIAQKAPTRQAAAALWPHLKHRELLFDLLTRSETPPDVRLYLLRAFAAEDELRAADGARSVIEDYQGSEEPLLIAGYETLSKSGTAEDLPYLEKAASAESPQMRALRRKYREQLQSRVK